MSALYLSRRMAEGYARRRPAVHPHVIDRLRRLLRIGEPLACALDVGCGTGLSTAPLRTLARRTIGIEPSEAMLAWTREVAPGALFAAGRAEELPIRSHSIDLITAAGSLNWADLPRFFAEARRVLTPAGKLAVYDFGQGRDFSDSDLLARWDDEFKRRWPSPPCPALDPGALAAACRDLRAIGDERFEIGLELSPDFYLEYAMTETNVADALRRGVPEGEIRGWCGETLPEVFGGRAHTVLFQGYIACFGA